MASLAPQEYQYDDLPTEQSFRVVELLPGTGHDVVACLLHVADWAQPPTYEAISYTWGDASLTAGVLCHGRICKVTANLHEALCHLRFSDRSRFLWADALCTNQCNIRERGNQVNQMKRIYTCARRVLIWLGPDTLDNMARTAFDLIQQFADVICDSLGISMADLQAVDDVYEKIVLKERQRLPLPDECAFASSVSWNSLKWFYSHNYFTRVWVIQEINANEDRLLHCGYETIDWPRVHLVAAYLIMETSWSKTFGFSDTFCWWISTVSGELKHHGADWLHMLYLASNFSCTDSRDIIYSLRGMIRIDSGSSLLRPDYSKALLDVYRDSVKAAFVNFENTDVLLYTSGTNDPSWIPQWHQPMLFRNPFRFGKALPWRPGGNSKPIWKIETQSNTLLLSGFIADTIEIVESYNESYFGNALLDSSSGQDFLSNFWQEVLEKIKRGFGEVPLSRSTLQATASAFCFGLDENSTPGKDSYLLLNFLAYLRSLLSHKTFERYIPKELAEEAMDSDGRVFGKPVWDFEYPESTFFITNGKLIGCATAKNLPGDVLFIPCGSTYPCVLRPKDEHFLVRGFAWISGVMHGEIQNNRTEVLSLR